MPFLFCLPGPAAQRAQDGSPIRRAKNARRAPRLIAPPAAPAAAPTAPAAPAAPAAGRPRAAKARAVWQPHRAPPRHENSPVSRTPHAAHHRPVCRAAAKSPAKHPTGCAPVPKHAPPPVRAGARSPFVRFVPSSSMSRSAQSQEPRRTIAKTTARYGMGRSAARMVSGEHRKSRSARPQEPPRSRPRQAAPVQSAASSSALGS